MNLFGKLRGRRRRRLTSFSLPFLGGAGWQTLEGDRDVLHELFVFLEDRNVLSIEPWNAVNPDHIVDSVREIREELVGAAKRLGPNSPASGSVLKMREVCAGYLHWKAAASPEGLFFGLGRIQGVFSTETRALAERYDLEPPERLRTALDEPKLHYLEQAAAVRYPTGREIDPITGETRAQGLPEVSWDKGFLEMGLPHESKTSAPVGSTVGSQPSEAPPDLDKELVFALTAIEVTSYACHEAAGYLHNTRMLISRVREEFEAQGSSNELFESLEESTDELVRCLVSIRASMRAIDEPMRVVQLSHLWTEATKALARPLSVQRISVRPFEGDVEVEVVPTLIVHMLVSLLLNSVQAFTESRRSNRAVELTVEVEKLNFILIGYRDNGPGLLAHQLRSPDDLVALAPAERIFRPGVTSHFGAAGLGLPVARRIAEQHGGQLTCAPTDDGIHFVIRLPLRR